MSSPPELDAVVLRLIDGQTILDLACGLGKWGCLIRTSLSALEKTSMQKEYIIGTDLFLPHLLRAKYLRVYDDTIQHHISYLPFRDKSLDVVLAAEVIEHLTPENGYLLLKEMERVSRKTVIVTTPTPRVVFSGETNRIMFSPYDKHITSWRIRDFKKLGFRVYSVRTVPYFATKNFPLKLILTLLNAISFWIPELATQVIAVKKVNRDNK